MSFKSAPSVAGVDPIDPRRWVLLDEAAERLGLTKGHLSRQCRDELERFGQARKVAPPEGGTSRWYIARRFDMRLAAGGLGDAYQAPDLTGYTETQRNTAFARAACVRAYKDARSAWTGSQKTWLPLLVDQLAEQHPSIKVSAASLRRWWRDFKRPADLTKLIDRRGRNKGGDADAKVWDYFRSIYLDGRQPTIRVCWMRADGFAQAEGLAWCSYDACRRQLDERIPPQMQAQFREPEKYRNSFRPYLPQDPEAYAAGERWDGDHAQLDFWCLFEDKPLRPWLTAWLDWRSRKIVGWVLSDGPNSSTVLAALRVGMYDESNLGGPDLVWIDNGKDYDSYTFHGQTKRQRQEEKRDRARLARIEGGMRVDKAKADGVFNMLDIEAHFSIPHNPTGKARIERWFGTLHGQFDKTFPSYCGRSYDHKPEGLDALLKQPHKLPAFEHVRERLADFIAGYNATVSMNREGAIGMSPEQAMAELSTRQRTFNPNVLDLCLQHWHRPVTVHRNGITISPWGKALSYGRHESRLAAYKRAGPGQKKPRLRVAYDPDDIRTIQVYDEHYQPICTLAADGFASSDTPVGRKEVGELIGDQRRYKASRRDVAQNAHYEYLSTGEPIALQQHRKAEQAGREARLKFAHVEVEGPSKPAVDTAKRSLLLPSLDQLNYGAKELAERSRPRPDLLERIYGDCDFGFDEESDEEVDRLDMLRKAVSG